MEYTTKLHINITYQISSIQALHTFQHPYIQETKKLIHDFILYKETSFMKMESKYCIMGSINEDKQ